MRMMKAKIFMPVLMLAISLSVISCAQNAEQKTTAASQSELTFSMEYDGKPVEKTEEEWKDQLEGFAFQVLRHQATERAFSGQYNKFYEDGVYYCAGCGLAVFDSETKFDSGTGWPSFYEPVSDKNVGKDVDHDIGYVRTEVHCARCGGHMGHVFEDAFDQPGGLRYCINSASLVFEKR